MNSGQPFHRLFERAADASKTDTVKNAGTSEGAIKGWATRKVHSVPTPVGEVAVHEIVGGHTKSRYFTSVDGKVSPATEMGLTMREGRAKHKESVTEADEFAKRITEAHTLHERVKDGPDKYLATVNKERLAKTTSKFTQPITY